MRTSSKHTRRDDHYRTMAAGYQVLRSPLADSYHAAAEHYRLNDPPLDPAEGSDIRATEEPEPADRRG